MSQRDRNTESRGQEVRRQRALPRQSIWERIPIPAYIGGIAALILGLAFGLPWVAGAWHHGSSDHSESHAAAADATDLGKLAPAFILNDYKGTPHPITPGDGRPKVLLFYMGYF